MNSAKQLAEYLHFLDGNETAYRRYFDWRFEQTGALAPSEKINPWCSLCENLISATSGDGNRPSKFYPDIYSWWITETHCQNRISPN